MIRRLWHRVKFRLWAQERAKWPRCPYCGRAIPPNETEHERLCLYRPPG
jgi:hypothetical protein